MSDNSILTRLKSKIEELYSLKRVNAHLEDVSNTLAEKYKELEQITSQLKKEEKDVKSLENKGFRPLFYKILGDKEKQLETERQEYLAVSLKYNALREEIDIIEYEKDLLQKKSISFPKVKKEVEDLKRHRQEELLNSGNPKREEVALVLKKYDHSVILGKEIAEAITASSNAYKNLDGLTGILRQALDWGRWRGRNSSGYAEMMKRSKLSEASRALAVTQRSLDYFAKEMSDLGETNMRLTLNFNELNKFTDYFLDNLITDWIIQQKIKNTLNSVLVVKDKVDRIKQSLDKEFQNNKQNLAELLKERDRILLSQ